MQSVPSSMATRTSAASKLAVGAAPLDVPVPLAVSQEIRDRGSAFVAYIYRVRTTEEAREALGRRRRFDAERYARERAKRHTHTQTQTRTDTKAEDGGAAPTPYTVAAWRCMALKPGSTGLSGPDEFEVVGGSEDGGERYAGGRVMEVMRREGVIDAVVIVSRWFGGTLLGPVRFAHTEMCAGEVCRRFKKIEEMDECVETLTRLDGVLAILRAQLAVMYAQAPTAEGPSRAVPDDSQAKSKGPDYQVMRQGLDLSKARRLIHARESAIQNTKTLIEKYRTSTWV